jgi:hypothetical protein
MKHSVTIDQPQFAVSNSPIIQHIRAGERKLGRVLTSRGGIEWIPCDAEKGYRMAWEQFDEIMRMHGHR